MLLSSGDGDGAHHAHTNTQWLKELKGLGESENDVGGRGDSVRIHCTTGLGICRFEQRTHAAVGSVCGRVLLMVGPGERGVRKCVICVAADARGEANV